MSTDLRAAIEAGFNLRMLLTNGNADRALRETLDEVLPADTTVRPGWTMPDEAFRSLGSTEEAEFRAWARANHKPGEPVDGLWHPVVRDECARIDAEFRETS